MKNAGSPSRSGLLSTTKLLHWLAWSAVLILPGFVCLSAAAQATAPNEWTWVGGSSAGKGPNGWPGVYGTQGTPAPGNIAGARDSAATWTDGSGNFWLFGGEGADARGNFGQLNDLWM